ncbi:hypothetical protein [Hymenobacter rigui]|uniref:Type I restriction enzyme R protein N-terminal domain-containing protein n=1 Tax=Hymenobacter rigui TaxID=334424 RepID=A0A3R9N7I5_9BACT|nr:hypothetical protein [Hymenobacter rigui]RSK50081.1 hypothetical protein EI291_05370 [Hymenobacter rigui]
MTTLAQVLAILKGRRFDLQNEKVLQLQLAQAFEAAALPAQREVSLSPASIIDFMVGSIGVEVKIKGTPKAIYQQCQRYCESEHITSLLLLTNKQVRLPASLHGKHTHVFNLGLSWL